MSRPEVPKDRRSRGRLPCPGSPILRSRRNHLLSGASHASRQPVAGEIRRRDGAAARARVSASRLAGSSTVTMTGAAQSSAFGDRAVGRGRPEPARGAAAEQTKPQVGASRAGRYAARPALLGTPRRKARLIGARIASQLEMRVAPTPRRCRRITGVRRRPGRQRKGRPAERCSGLSRPGHGRGRRGETRPPGFATTAGRCPGAAQLPRPAASMAVTVPDTSPGADRMITRAGAFLDRISFSP